MTFANSNNLLFIAPFLEGDEAFLGASVNDLLDFVSDISQMTFSGQVEVLLNFTVRHHQLENTIVIIADASDFSLGHDRSRDHITSTESFIILLVSEDVLGSDHSLGRTVLSWLGGGEGGDLAGELFLHDDKRARFHAASFSKLGVKSTRISSLEFVLVRHLLVFSIE